MTRFWLLQKAVDDDMAPFGIHRTPLWSSFWLLSASEWRINCSEMFNHHNFTTLSHPPPVKNTSIQAIRQISNHIQPTLRQAVEERNGVNRCNKRGLWREPGRLEVSDAAPEPFAKITAPLKGPLHLQASAASERRAIYFSAVTLWNERHYSLVCQQRLHRSYD